MKSQQRFRSKKHDAFTEESNRIAMSASDDKRIQLISSIETYEYRISKDLICKNN